MLISGTIAKVDPPDYQDQYNNHHQNITVQTVAGPILGRKASKTPYGVNDVNRQVEWDCTRQTSNRGPYNKFTKPQDPQYAQQGSQQTAGQPNAPQQGQRDARSTSIERQAVWKGACNVYMGQGDAASPQKVVALAIAGQYFVETGNNLAKVPDYPDEGSQVPPNSPNPAMGGSDDIPF